MLIPTRCELMALLFRRWSVEQAKIFVKSVLILAAIMGVLIVIDIVWKSL